MSQRHLFDQLDRVTSRYRHLWRYQAWALVWLLAALLAGAAWMWKIRTGASVGSLVALLVIAAVASAAIAAWLIGMSARNYGWIVRRLESAFPELGMSLLAAVEQRPELPDGRFGYLQASVINQALGHSKGHAWTEIVSDRRISLAYTASVLAFAMFAMAILGAMFSTVPASVAEARRLSETAGLAGSGFSVTVEPGDVEVERGTSLLVLARVHGEMPPDAVLVHQNDDGQDGRLPMEWTLKDPVFGCRIPAVNQPLKYHVELGGQTTDSYQVTVFDYPQLERADAHLMYPAYTGTEERLVQDVRTVSVVEGTQLTLRCYLNKPVASAVLSETRPDVSAEPIALTASSDDPLLYRATIACQQSLRLSLALVDEAGRKNTKPATFSINVLPNQPPSLKPIFPGRDLEVSALEEMDIKSTAWDDFGLKRVGFTYSIAGNEPTDVVLASDAQSRQRLELSHAVFLEELEAEPDQLLSYHWWAEDFGPDGQLRRTLSDMYFAEVRPFEEIFRQGQAPPGGQQNQQQQQGQGQNAQLAQHLAQLQKDIINATWKLIRREAGSNVSDAFASDAEQVHLSQSSALEQALALGEKLQDEKSKEHLQSVIESMTAAADHLKTAHSRSTKEPLKPALSAEQAAYQALLKLRAREHEVVRQQQRGQQSGSQSASRSQQQQQQLQQLALNDEENRYETQRAARDQSDSPESREDRQVLNRLRELARRQSDLNERLKELQTALKEAPDEQQREEIRRQLKRLQDEQRQILQDTDELQSRLEQPENLERMSEQRDQLSETREQVRRASEALEQDMVTQAAASGTRAEQQFEDLREEFRRRASNQFSEELQQMRQAARELDEREQQIAEQIKAQENEQQRKLTDDADSQKVAEELAQQRQRLADLQNQMRDTITQAESSEPLLSEKLYESTRDIQDRKLDQVLEATERSIRRGLQQDAEQLEKIAGQGIRQLREAIDDAAEAVLGDGTEALRRAREELEDLSQELGQEIARNSPEGDQQGQSEDQQSTELSQDRSPSGQQPSGEAQRGGDSQERQAQPGSRPAGEGTNSAQRNSEQPSQTDQRGSRKSDDQKSPGQRSGSEQQPRAEQDSRSKGGQPQEGSEQRGQGQQGQPQEGRSEAGEPQEGASQSSQSQPGDGRGEAGQNQQRRAGEPRSSSRGMRLTDGAPSDRTEAGGFRSNEGSGSRNAAPIEGEDFREWSDRLRDVEEMVDDPELRAQAARIRERAQALRADMKRHSALPNWDLVRVQIQKPLVELQDLVAQELLRRTSKKAIVPLDRDPVPPEYAEKARRYYERLGSGK